MKLSALGLWFIKHRETKDGKPDLVAYKDPGSKDGLPITAGYGATRKLDGTRFTLGERITEKYAEDCLLRDVSWAEAAVNQSVKVPLNSNQFDSLVSFSYNVGVDAFKTSTLLKVLNAGDYDAAADQMLRWVFNDGVEMQGLKNRRFLERRLFKFEPRNIAKVPSEDMLGSDAEIPNDPVDPPTIMVPEPDANVHRSEPLVAGQPIRKQVPVPVPAPVPAPAPAAVVVQETQPVRVERVTTNWWGAMRAGWVLASADTWKNRQIAIAALVTLISFAVGLLKVAGYDLGWSETEISSVAAMVFAVGYGLFNLWATAATTARVGMPARSEPNPQPPDDGKSSGPRTRPDDNPYVG